MAPWPFAQWGVDLVGSFPLGKGGVKYMIMAVDYFMKLAKVESLATITSKVAMRIL